MAMTELQAREILGADVGFAKVKHIIYGDDAHQKNALRTIARARFMEENVRFLMAVADYKKQVKGAQRVNFVIPLTEMGSQATIGTWIYRRFVSGDAPEQVNLAAANKEALDTIYASDGHPFTFTSFNAAENEIAQLLALNI